MSYLKNTLSYSYILINWTKIDKPVKEYMPLRYAPLCNGGICNGKRGRYEILMDGNTSEANGYRGINIRLEDKLISQRSDRYSLA